MTRTPPDVEIRLLGPLQVRHRGQDLPIAGALARRLLTVLALNASQPVPATQLMDRLWPEEPPAAGINALQQRVASLRRTLKPVVGDVLVSVHGGYQLNLPRTAVDALALEDAVTAAQVAAADPAASAAQLDSALGRWSGDPVPDLGETVYATGQVSRLVSLHAQAVELRADAGLVLGQEQQLEPMLRSAVAGHPYAERLRGQLMRVLARRGRQAEALQLYQEGRDLLADELGVDPSPELQAVFHAVLAGEVATPLVAAEREEGGPVRQEPPAPRTGPTASPPATRSAPRWVTVMVGRDQQIARVAQLLRGSPVLTLTGPGGVGKTRLAAAAAERVATELDLPLGFVDLATIPTGADIEPQVMTALGLLTGGDTSIDDARTRILDHLGREPCVLVLDNCEHVLDSAARLVEQLAAGGFTPLLTTSREPLTVPAETVWSVPPLQVPAAELSAEEVLNSASVRLFLDRARQAAPDDPVGEDDAELLARLARRLDGIPLALELAAGRLRTFGLERLVDQLDRTLSVLSLGSRTAAPRQQALRGAVEWSYNLLTPEEQTFFRRLGLFAGPFTADAAAATTAHARHPSEDQAEQMLLGLVDRSLLTYDRATGRYRMLQTISDFAAERLTASDEQSTVGRALVEHYGRVADSIAARSRGSTQGTARRRARDEHPNLIRALDTALADVEKGSHHAANLARALWWPWLLNDDRLEARQRLHGVLHAPGLSDSERGQLLVGAIFLDLDRYQPPGEDIHRLRALADATGDAALAGWARLLTAAATASISTRLLPTFVPAQRRRLVAADLESAEELFHRAGDDWAQALTGVLRAVIAFTGGDGNAAQPFLHAVEPVVAALGDPWLQVKFTQTQAIAAMTSGQLATADRLHRDALSIADAEQLRESQATLRSQLGGLALAAGALSRARDHFQASLSLVHRLGISPAEGWPRNGLGMLARREGRPHEAIRHHQRALQLYSSVRHRVGVPYSRVLLGLAHIAAGNRQSAETELRQACDEARHNSEPAVRALSLIGLAELAAANDPAEARRHLADARKLLDSPAERSPLVPLPGNYDLDRVAGLLPDADRSTRQE